MANYWGAQSGGEDKCEWYDGVKGQFVNRAV